MNSKTPPLENTKSPEEKCRECKGDKLKFCLECLHRINDGDIFAMVQDIMGFPLTSFAPTFKVSNDRLVTTPSETSDNTFPPSDDDDNSGCDGPASPNPIPNSPEISEIMSVVNVSDERMMSVVNVSDEKILSVSLSNENVENTNEEPKNYDYNFGNRDHIIELSEKLTPTISNNCAKCEDFHAPRCDVAHAISMLDWVENAEKCAAENQEDYEMKKLFEKFKFEKCTPLGEIHENINDIDDSDDSINDINE